MTLDGLEHVLHDKYWRCSPTSQINVNHNCHKVHLARFADDFIITGDAREICEEILELIKPFLKERGVELSEEKTVITHIEDGFDFLGWNFRKYKGKLLIKPSKKSVKKVLRKVRDIINDNQAASQRELVRRLNPVIRGWRNYHNHVVATKAFGYVHNAIFEALWHWAIRRHKNKCKWWIKDRYWHPVDNDGWVFYNNSEEIGKQNPLLIRISNSKIVRHPMLQVNRNPFLDKVYFERRSLLLGAKRLTGKFGDIWRKQQGKCLYCNQPMSMDSSDIHHNWPTAWGGTDVVANLVYLHQLCHKSYHMRFPTGRNATRVERLRYEPLKKLGSYEQAIRNAMEKWDA
jgi:RNA-directed DNA polymerase